eukprot:6404292-Pyramimonas_sp.AAC.1
MSLATGVSRVPRPCGVGPCGEVLGDYEVARSVTAPFRDSKLASHHNIRGDGDALDDTCTWRYEMRLDNLAPLASVR